MRACLTHPEAPASPSGIAWLEACPENDDHLQLSLLRTVNPQLVKHVIVPRAFVRY
jgi:hypothetical protein